MENMLICQSCAMPLETEEMKGTNHNHSKSEEYCTYCFHDGTFTENKTMEEMIVTCCQYAKEMNFSEEDAQKYFKEVLPTLKRWKL